VPFASSSARFKEPQARHLTLKPGVGWDAACRVIFSRLSAAELRQAQTVRPSSQQAIAACFDDGRAFGRQGRRCPLKSSGLLNLSRGS
jgi:hypothetical protein